MNRRILFILTLVLALSCLTNAQESPDIEDFKKREIKIDLIYPLFDMLKMGYEYCLDYRSSVILTAFYNFSKKPEVQGQALASYRLYFLKFRRGPWFFAESNLGYTKGYNYDYWSEEPLEKYNAFTVGLSGGGKFYIPKTDTGFEIVLGLNRLYSNKDLSEEIIANFGINLVKRF